MEVILFTVNGPVIRKSDINCTNGECVGVAVFNSRTENHKWCNGGECVGLCLSPQSTIRLAGVSQ